MIRSWTTQTRRAALTGAALALAAGLVAPQPAAAEDLKVGFIYVGPVGDYGWTYQHDQGRLAIEEAFGDRVSTSFLESVGEGPDAVRAIERLARSGHDLIFTTSFGFMEPTLEVAAKYPDVKFEHATGYKRADNVSTYSSRFYEGRYVIGQMAARMSETGTAGYIASFPIPEVVRGINAFLLGAQSVNPDFSLKVVWVNTWFDPGKEADAAKTLIDQGVDILTQHTDSTAAMQVAAERGIMAFGQASDMIAFGPETQMTSIIDNWNDYYVARTQAALDGTWNSEDMWGGMDTKMVVMAPITNVPDDVKAEAEKTIAAITSGDFHPFTGPINKQNGEAWLAEGEIADEGTMLGMNFYVEGVDDTLPE